MMKIRELSREPSIAERIRLVEDIRDRIVEDQSRLPVSEVQNREVDQRLEVYRLTKDPGEPAVDAIERIRANL